MPGCNLRMRALRANRACAMDRHESGQTGPTAAGRRSLHDGNRHSESPGVRRFGHPRSLLANGYVLEANGLRRHQRELAGCAIHNAVHR